MTPHAVLTKALPVLAALAMLLGAPTAALARGGRATTPAPAAPSDPEAAPSPAEPTLEPGHGTPSCPSPPPPPPSPQVEPPTASVPTRTPSRPRRAGAVPGATTWPRWYGTNRERYEDHRVRYLLTETSPVFAVGEVVGPHRGLPTQRLTPDDRSRLLAALRRVLEVPGTHWIHTEAAALVALGKVAEQRTDLDAHFALLEPEASSQEYLKESAVIGFGNLRRDEERHRLGAGLLDRVRKVLVHVLGSDTYRPKTRGHAALALGLLADQPSSRGKDGPGWTARHLFDVWIEMELGEEAEVGLLMGLARIPPDATTPLMRLVLGGCTLRGGNWPRARSALVRAHAALTLARIGQARDALTLVALLERTKGESSLLQQAAPTSAAILGERVPDTRGLLGRAVIEALDEQREPGSRRLLFASLGRLLAAEAREGDEFLLVDRKAGDLLLDALAEGAQEERPYAALALGMVARAVGRDVRTADWNDFHRRAIEGLRHAFESDVGDVATRGAHATALGVAGDGNSVQRILDVLVDEDRPPELRAWCALALGLLGDGRKAVTRAATAAIQDPRSDLLQSCAATALGLLADGDKEKQERLLELLVRELRLTPQVRVKGQIAITLGRIGDPRAIRALTDMLESPDELQLNRSMACAALGLLGERDLHPALAPTRWDSHYLSSSALVFDVLDVL